MVLDTGAVAPKLLAWYDRHRRILPWRAVAGESVDPYRVWLSEIMLQQTVVATVIPYFRKFLARWPSVHALATAPLDDVLTEWAGLGYYARARNLHRCAQEVVERFDGVFPSAPAQLLSLPGIGVYTAGAIAAIAFDLPFAAVDGNVERVTARLARIETPLAVSRELLRGIAQSFVPAERAGDFAQAMMDLGSAVCVPVTPRCGDCPLSDICLAFRSEDAGKLPIKLEKRQKPTRHGHVYWLADASGAILVRRRQEKGLLGGMMEFPSSPWIASRDGLHAPPISGIEWRVLPGLVRHTFTHFHLELAVLIGSIDKPAAGIDGQFISPDRFGEIALPSLMHKVAAHASKQGDPQGFELFAENRIIIL